MLGRVSAIFHKGDKFCDFLFSLQNSNPLLKRVYAEFCTSFRRSLLKEQFLGIYS